MTRTSQSSREVGNRGNTEQGREHCVKQQGTKRCYICGHPGHIAKDCRAKPVESRGQGESRNQGGGRTPHSGNRAQQNGSQNHRKTTATTQAVQSASSQTEQEKPGVECSETSFSLTDFLYSSDDDDTRTLLVRVKDGGSCPQRVRVEIQGVPAEGVIDSGADITIIGGELFKKVAAVARLRKKDLKEADKTPRNYDQSPFKLDGRMDLEILFDDKAMVTPVYIKMDAHEQLLLSEGVCRQLGIIHYHPSVKPHAKRSQNTNESSKSTMTEVRIPTVTINLVESVRILPGQSSVAKIQLDTYSIEGPVLLQQTEVTEKLGLYINEGIVQPTCEGEALAVITNHSGFTQKLSAGTTIGTAEEADMVEVPSKSNYVMEESNVGDVWTVTGEEADSRGQRLLELVGKPELLNAEQLTGLGQFLSRHNQAFSLEPGERGETDLVQLEIDTQTAIPKRQSARRMPFAVRQEVARQLKEMQEGGIICPSQSAWASPVILVRKKNGSHRFCVDYRQLNSVTKPDRFPLPRIDDLLDQLAESTFFTTLDLASGYWQIRVHPKSREKTAFITPQGLYEFMVMPFGLTNAPSVFQRLMQQVLQGLNPEGGPDFVSVYIDDVLVFSQTLEEHWKHLDLVLERLEKAGLKLQPTKCHFIRTEVEYLGHVISPEGLKTNEKLVAAVKEFPTPKDLKELRRFLGLSSYYRRFIPQFAKLAGPLHDLTRDGVAFNWTESHRKAFELIKQRLVKAPVLSYPSFSKDFILETDASAQGLGAILSQEQEDGQVHPVAYASRALSPSERNYSITEMETLAVVWAISHFQYYLYGQSVTVYTDHTAVKAVLEVPNPTGKHARWWMKVYGQGVKNIKIVYRSGKSNVNADALSRGPQAAAPQEESEPEVQVPVVTDDQLVCRDR